MATEDFAARRPGTQLFDPSIRNIDRALGFTSDEAFEMATEVRRAVKQMAAIRRRRMRLERQRHALARKLLFSGHGKAFWRTEHDLARTMPAFRREKVAWLLSELEAASRQI
jgi:hypothetical protein